MEVNSRAILILCGMTFFIIQHPGGSEILLCVAGNLIRHSIIGSKKKGPCCHVFR